MSAYFHNLALRFSAARAVSQPRAERAHAPRVQAGPAQAARRSLMDFCRGFWSRDRATVHPARTVVATPAMRPRTFSQIVSSESYRSAEREALSSENGDFIRSVNHLKQQPSPVLVDALIKTFVEASSLEEINIQGDLRTRLIQAHSSLKAAPHCPNAQEAFQTLIDNAYLEVKGMIVETKDYKKLMADELEPVGSPAHVSQRWNSWPTQTAPSSTRGAMQREPIHDDKRPVAELDRLDLDETYVL